MAPRLAELGGWREVFTRLFARQDLGGELAESALGEVLAGEATNAQIAAFITGLRMKGETVEEMAGMVQAMLGASQRVVVEGDLLDTCGTGGDRRRSINVSTIAAFVVAGAGVKVCKHGNRAASSASGSADVLEALGVAINLGPEGVATCIKSAGMGFCFAPRFHPAMRYAGPVRAELGVPTVLNLLGPLANPGRAKFQLVGVADAAVAEKIAGVLAANGARRAMVVFGDDGLDELTTTTWSTVVELADGELKRWKLDPASLGIAPAEMYELVGGDAQANAAAARAVLAGVRGPHRDIVLLNAAAALLVAGSVADLEQGLGTAETSIDSGAAGASMEALVKCSQEAAIEEGGGR